MHIAFLVGRFPQLSETFVLNQVTGLLDRGQDVDVFARKSGEGKTHTDFETYRLRERTHYRDMPKNPVARWGKALAVGARGAMSHPAAVGGSLNVLRHGREASSLKLLYSAMPFLKKGKRYHIVHAHFGPQGLLAVKLQDLGAINSDARLITTFYGYDVHRYPLNHGRDVYRPLFDRASLILTLSHRMKDDLAGLGCDPAKLLVHHIGTNPARFGFQPRQSATDGVVRLVSVARHVEKKGLEYAIRAVGSVAGSHRLTYDIIGDGPLRPAYERLIRELSVENQVRLLGWKTQAEVVEVLGQAHILLAPSVTAADGDQEGTPVALMEAMAMGLPVVSTHHAGIPEIVTDGVNGYLVPERDSEALAERLSHLMRYPETWQTLGTAGRQTVEREFDVNKLNDRLVELYTQQAPQIPK
jgi:colanic acid/amylovoran biosynthesis glycosyltransferase